jgi:hypothetical protein
MNILVDRMMAVLALVAVMVISYMVITVLKLNYDVAVQAAAFWPQIV